MLMYVSSCNHNDFDYDGDSDFDWVVGDNVLISVIVIVKGRVDMVIFIIIFISKINQQLIILLST
jgi:hypothetical protein